MTVVGGSTDHLIVDRSGDVQADAVLEVRTLAGVTVTDVTAPVGWTGQAFPEGKARADGDGYFRFVVPDGTGPVQVRTAAHTVGTKTFAAGPWLDVSGQVVPDSALEQALAAMATDADIDAAVAAQAAVDSATYARTVGVHVIAHGAVGNGVTDDTAAIEAARVALVAQGGGVLDFGPAGRTYKVSKITVSSGIEYMGRGSTLVATSATPEGVFQAEGWGNTTDITDTAIRGFRIDCGNVARRGVFLYRAARCVVEGNTIFNLPLTGDSGVRLHWLTTSCIVRGNHITLQIDSPFGTVPSQVGVYALSQTPDSQGGGQNNTLTFAAATELATKHLITGNTVLNGTHGVGLSAAQDCQVTDNYLEGQSHRGILMSPLALRNVIHGNNIREYGSTGIHMAWGCTGNAITGNVCVSTVSNLEGNGIKGYYGCSDNTVTGNIIDGAFKGGIRFAMGSARNNVSSNYIRNAGIGIQIQSYLPGSDGYYQPTSPPAADGNTITGNTVSGSAKGVELEANGGANVTNTGLRDNDLLGVTTSGVSVVESTTTVSGLTAVGNTITGAGSTWVLPRGQRHLLHATANTDLAPTPAGMFLRSGYYYQATPSALISTAILGTGVLRASALKVANAVTLTRIGLEVTGAGDAGSVLRLCLYASDGKGAPSLLVLDAGTVPGDVVGVVEVTISQPLTPGTYWVGAVPQNVTTVQPTVRALIASSGAESDGPSVLTSGTTPLVNQTGASAYSMTGVTGAVPATFASVGPTTTVARIFIKVA